MIGGIVLTHGKISSALIEASESIMGEVDNVLALSTTNLSLDEINSNLKKIIASHDWQDGILIMVSLMGGSCWNSAIKLIQQVPKVEVVSGVNLTMLISFLSKRNNFPLEDLAEIIKKDGIRGIDKYTGNSI